MSPCWGVLWCPNTTQPHRPPPARWPELGCECISASVGAKSFHASLHNALRHRRCLSKDPATRDRAQRLSERWARKNDYGLLAYGILELTSFRGGGGGVTSRLPEHDQQQQQLLLPPQPQPSSNPTRPFWLEFGVAAGGSTNITCDALAARLADRSSTLGGDRSQSGARHHHTRVAAPPQAQAPGPSWVRVHGFDTFTGLPESWAHMPKGRFSQHGILPPTQPCAVLHKGLIKDTLPEWLARQQQPHSQQLSHESLQLSQLRAPLQQQTSSPPSATPTTTTNGASDDSARTGAAASGRHSVGPLLGVSIDVDLYSASYDALRALQRARLLQNAVVHFHELVVPYGPADSNLHHPTEGAFHMHTSYKTDRNWHYIETFMRKRAEKMPKDPNDAFFVSDEQRALYDSIRKAPGACWWLVPWFFHYTVASPALFVVLDQGKAV